MTLLPEAGAGSTVASPGTRGRAGHARGTCLGQGKQRGPGRTQLPAPCLEAAGTTQALCSFPGLIRNVFQTMNPHPEPDRLEKGPCVP